METRTAQKLFDGLEIILQTNPLADVVASEGRIYVGVITLSRYKQGDIERLTNAGFRYESCSLSFVLDI